MKYYHDETVYNHNYNNNNNTIFGEGNVAFVHVNEASNCVMHGELLQRATKKIYIFLITACNANPMNVNLVFDLAIAVKLLIVRFLPGSAKTKPVLVGSYGGRKKKKHSQAK